METKHAEFIDKKSGLRFKTVTPYYESSWFEWLVLFLCLGVGWVLWSATHPAFITETGDSLHNLELGEAMAQWRYGFSQLDGHSLPMYPLVIATTLWITGIGDLVQVIDPLQQLNLLFYLMAVPLVYQFVRHQVDASYALVITVLFAWAPLMMASLGQTTPTLLYLLTSYLALLAIDKAFASVNHVGTRMQLFWCVLWLGISALAHPAGLALLGAFALVACRRLGFAHTLLVVGSIVLLTAPWYGAELYRETTALIHQEDLRRIAPPTATPLAKMANASSEDLLQSAQEAVQRATQTTLAVPTESPNLAPAPRSENMFEHVWPLDPTPLKISWLQWTFASLLLLGALYGFYRYAGAAPLYLMLYLGGGILLLPSMDKLDVLPLLPILLAYLYLAVERIGSWLKHIHIPFAPVVIPVLTVLIIFNGAGAYLHQLRTAHRLEQEKPGGLLPPVSSRRLPAPGPSGQHVSVQNPIAASAAPPATTAPVTPAETVSAKTVPAQSVAEKTLSKKTVSDKAPAKEAAPQNDQQLGYWRALDWVKQNTPKTAKLVAPRHDLTRVYTGRSTVALPPMSNDTRYILDKIHGNDYAIEEMGRPNALTQVIQSHPDHFKLLFSDPAAQIRVWQLTSPST